jgi:thioredoxin reductase (NADPH)
MYDVIIIGAGPAGLTAAVYSARFKMKILVLGELLGGTINEAHKVENWPGEKLISGIDLGQKMVDQVKNLGVEIKMNNAEKISKNDDGTFLVQTINETFLAKKIILAIGTQRRTLGLEREKELLGKGVSYCATCDSSFFGGKTTAVIGGGNSALSAALLLSESCEKVYIIYRRDSFEKADPIRVEMVEKNQIIEVIFKSKVVKLKGENMLDAIVLDNGSELKVQGLFIEIGTESRKEFLQEMSLGLDENGYVKVDKEMRTNIKGIFSAGDLNSGNFKQAIVASAEGAVAAKTAYNEIKIDSVK